MYNVIKHHGIKGQRWGIRNGPPYPMRSSQKKTAKYIKTGLIVAGSLLAAYGVYKLSKMDKNIGKEVINEMLKSGATVKNQAPHTKTPVEITQTFKNAVKDGKVQSVRIMMKNSLLFDPSFGEFEAMRNAASTMTNLFDKHDGTKFRTDKTTWDDNYMNDLMVEVVDNFSKERIEHLKDVVTYLSK